MLGWPSEFKKPFGGSLARERQMRALLVVLLLSPLQFTR
jgi:hypothetical protein